MIDLDTAAVARKRDLAKFFVECSSCGFDLRFDYYDQTRKCPQCSELTRLSEEYQEYLRRQRQETVEEVKAFAERLRREKA